MSDKKVCYWKERTGGPCCRDRRNNVLCLARIECGLKDAPTREEFTDYLQSRENFQEIRLIQAYARLTDDPYGLFVTQQINEEVPLLLRNSNVVQLLEEIDLSTALETDVNALKERLMNAMEDQLRENFQKFAEFSTRPCESFTW